LKVVIKISFENGNIFKIIQKCRALYVKRKYLYVDGSNIFDSMIERELAVTRPWKHTVLYVVDSEM